MYTESIIKPVFTLVKTLELGSLIYTEQKIIG